MNKNAFLDTATPLQVLLGSLGVGAGGYASMRLIQELMSKDQENLTAPGGLAIPFPEKKKTIPEEQGVKLASEDQTIDGVSDNLLKYLAVLGGAPAGVIGANALYHNYKENQIQQDIDNEQKKRLQIMAQFKQAAEKEEKDKKKVPQEIKWTPKTIALAIGGGGLGILAGQALGGPLGHSAGSSLYKLLHPAEKEAAEKEEKEHKPWMPGLKTRMALAAGGVAALSAYGAGQHYFHHDSGETQNTDTPSNPDETEEKPSPRYRLGSHGHPRAYSDPEHPYFGKNKQASVHTPNVDLFCTSLLTKLAEDSPQTQAIRNLAAGNLHRMLPFGEETAAALGATALATALYTGYTMVNARNAKKEKEEKSRYEDQVSLAPQTM